MSASDDSYLWHKLQLAFRVRLCGLKDSLVTDNFEGKDSPNAYGSVFAWN